jgi:hypothetical protein
MPEYIFLMHDDATTDEASWASYLVALEERGAFQGGSEIGEGICVRKAGAVPALSRHLSGFIRVKADNIDQARMLLAGNPVFEAGGTVEIRELPRSE